MQILKHHATWMFCWGARGFVNTGDGLKFKVSGRKFQGYVYIVLDRSTDFYDVLYGQIKNGEWWLVERDTLVDWENLARVIDEFVET